MSLNFSIAFVIAIVLFLIITFTSTAASATPVYASQCKRKIPIEHFYYDMKQEESSNTNEKQFISPVSVKLKCKGDGCPELNGTRVVLTQVPHHEKDVCNIPVWCEETSGWILFWRDDQWTQPLKAVVRAEEEEGRQYVYINGEKGGFAGLVHFGCEF